MLPSNIDVVGDCFEMLHIHVFLVPHWIPATCRSLAQTSVNEEFPSGKEPTTQVRLRISLFRRSITLFVRILVQRSKGKAV